MSELTADDLLSKARVIVLKPADVLLLEIDHPLTAEQAAAIKEQLGQLLPGRRLGVLDRTIRVADKTEETP